MLVERIWSGNDYRNFHYLIACQETGEALAVDPLEWQLCLDAARAKGWGSPRSSARTSIATIRAGTRGWFARRAPRCWRMPARRCAHRWRGSGAGQGRRDPRRAYGGTRMPRYAWPRDGACLPVGACPAEGLFCGDTLFNAGAGNCHGGGHPDALYQTFAAQLAKLPDDTRIYPGTSTWRATSSSRWIASPITSMRKALLAVAKVHRAREREGHDARRRKLVECVLPPAETPRWSRGSRERFPEIGETPDARTVFVKLRASCGTSGSSLAASVRAP